MHDVAIVGAGPGGSATAHFLAQRGLDVLLLDKAEFPRDKTCGDGLTPRALRVLDAMGILQEIERHGCAINGYEVVAPNGKRTIARIAREPGALAVPRRTLDELIRQRAVHSGAHFRPWANVVGLEPISRGVSIRTNTTSFEARIAVVATGASTALLKQTGILRQQPLAMLAMRTYFEAAHERDLFELTFRHVPLPGYGWVFPVGRGVVNVGVGFLPKRHSPTAQQAFQRFTSGLAQRRIEPVRGYPIRVDFLSAPTHAPRTLLVGEAAGLVNPLTGEGIDYALESGQIAAEHIAAAFELGAFDFSGYHRALHARFEKLFRFSAHVRDWYCLPPALNLLVPLANSRPALRQVLADIVLGEREPAGYGPLTMLSRLLLYLVRTRSRSFA
jgi:geranylgeranyl reductase family protein